MTSHMTSHTSQKEQRLTSVTGMFPKQTHLRSCGHSLSVHPTPFPSHPLPPLCCRCFSNPHTADLMKKKVQRQRKLEEKASRRKKMAGVFVCSAVITMATSCRLLYAADPSVRLALFRKQRQREGEGQGQGEDAGRQARSSTVRRPALPARWCLPLGEGQWC